MFRIVELLKYRQAITKTRLCVLSFFLIFRLDGFIIVINIPGVGWGGKLLLLLGGYKSGVVIS